MLRLIEGSEAITDGLRVQVEAQYSEEHSQPSSNQWFFLYTVRIANEGAETCQLVSRHWIIRNAAGEIEEVRGPGVVGEHGAVVRDARGPASEHPRSAPFGRACGRPFSAL